MKGKTYLFLCVLCFLLQKNKAQNYFNNRYDGSGSCDATNSVDTFQNKYFTSAVECNSVSFYSLTLRLFNSDGTFNKKKNYTWAGSNLLSNVGKYIHMKNQIYACGLWVYSGYKTKAFLWRFDSNLDSVKFTSYGFLNQENVVTTFIKQSDTKIYMTGYVDDTLQTNKDILLIKTDTAGNEIWKKKIGIAGIDESAISIDTLNGNLLIAGNKMSHGSSATQGFVMYLDTAANIIWQKTIITNGGFGGCAVKKLKDGNVLIYSRIKQYTIGSDDYYKLQVEKITANNISIWQKTYNAPRVAANPYSAIENKHGNIVIASQTGFYANMINGKVNEINQNGDSLFTKEYAIMPGSQNYFRDVMQTSDGGYCFAGFVNPLFAYGGTGTEDIWLLKVDSNFCESAVPCGYGLGVNEKIGIESGVRVYPNPANDVLHIELVDFNNEPHKIEVLNELGQVVFSQTTLNQQSVLNIRDLQNGMYYLYLKTANKMIIKKVIIQK